MFDAQESTPWYRSDALLIGACLLLPPVGLILLWARRDATTRNKIIGTAGIVVLGVGYSFLFGFLSRSGDHSPICCSEAASGPAARASITIDRSCRSNRNVVTCAGNIARGKWACWQHARSRQSSRNRRRTRFKKLLDQLTWPKSRWSLR